MASRFQSQHLNPAVLSEVMIKGEGPSDVTGLQYCERDRIAERPVLVCVSSEDLSGFLFFRGEYPNDRQSVCQQPLTGNRPPKLPQEERVRFRFDITSDEARACFGRDVTRHRHCTYMVGIVCIEQSENGT